MSNLTYKGYIGSIEPQLETNSLYGKVLYIRDLITYESKTVQELDTEFKASIDDYLDSCSELGKSPDKPFKGSFNIRTGPELHRKAALAAKGRSLNAFVCEAIQEKVEKVASTEKSMGSGL